MKHDVERKNVIKSYEKGLNGIDGRIQTRKGEEISHHRHRDSLDALQVDDFPWPPVECLETLDVGEFKELLKTYSPSTYWTSWNEVRCLRRA